MDFPQDPRPTPDEMVGAYVETCAKGLNISLEEVKKRMYACITTTYQGFQAIMTEEESKKFEGDKYENGVITPRPPPIQQRNKGGRFRDQNRNPGRPRYNPQGGPIQNQQGGLMQNQQGGPMQSPPNSWGPTQGDGRNYRAPQNMPQQQNYQPQQNYRAQQNFGTLGQGERGGSMPMNNTNYAPGGRDSYQADRRGPMPSYQEGSYNQGQQQGNRYPSQADNRQSNFARDNMNYTPPSTGGIYGQRASWQGNGQGNAKGDRKHYAPPMGVGQIGTYQGRY